MIFNMGSRGSVSAEAVKYGDYSVAETLDGLVFSTNFLSDYTSSINDTVGNVIDDLTANGVRMEIQSYTGAGSYGASSPCVLTFSFVPKVIIFIGAMSNTYQWHSIDKLSADGTTATIYNDKVLTDTLTTSYKNYNGFYTNNAFSSAYIKKSEDNKTVTWYNTSTTKYQLNDSAFTYYFMGIS